MVGAMISSMKDKLPEQLDKIGEVPPGIDEFTHLFGQDDIRMLVDLLKLAVSGRSSEKSRESVASLLQ